MKQYFDFTPYVTDTPVSFDMRGNRFAKFIHEQLEYEHIPTTIEPHTIIVDEGGPVEGTPFIAPPEEEVTHTTMTAPLSQTIIKSILADDKLIFKGSSKLQQAYDAWYIDNMKRCTQR